MCDKKESNLGGVYDSAKAEFPIKGESAQQEVREQSHAEYQRDRTIQKAYDEMVVIENQIKEVERRIKSSEERLSKQQEALYLLKQQYLPLRVVVYGE